MSFNKHEISWTPQKAARVWDYYSSNPSYKNQYFAYQAGHLVATEIKAAMDMSKIKTAVDFSCGPGDLLIHLLPLLNNGQKIFGVDVSPNSVDIVNRRFENDSRFGGAEMLDQFSAKWENESCDLIISTEVVEHLGDDDLDNMLSESQRLLEPGGYLFITTRNNEDLEANKTMCPDCGCVFHRWQHQRVWTPESLQQKVEEYSFQTVNSYPVSWSSRLRKLVSFIKPAPKNGLVYVGQKI